MTRLLQFAMLAVIGAGCFHGRAHYAREYRAQYMPGCLVVPRTPTTVAPTPAPAPADHEARGSLSREVIRRVIGREIGDVRRCYERALTPWPRMTGRVELRFIIDPDGRVAKAAVLQRDGNLPEPAVGCCIAQAMKTWKFPAPAAGGIVVVTYPFVLQQG